MVFKSTLRKFLRPDFGDKINIRFYNFDTSFPIIFKKNTWTKHDLNFFLKKETIILGTSDHALNLPKATTFSNKEKRKSLKKKYYASKQAPGEIINLEEEKRKKLVASLSRSRSRSIAPG